MCSKAQKHVHVEEREKRVTQKRREFVNEPMGEKPVTTLPGVGPTLRKRLVDAGFDKAYVVLGQFLVLKKDQERFTKWMEDTTGRRSLICWQSLNDWCERWLH